MPDYRIKTHLLRNIFQERKFNCFVVQRKQYWFTPWRDIAECYTIEDAVRIINNNVFHDKNKQQ